MNEQSAFRGAEAVDALESDEADRCRADPDGREGVDFASRQAARGKMRIWLTAFTAAAALAVLAVVSLSAVRPG